MKRWLPLGLIAAGLIGVVYALFFLSSDEDLIHDRLVQLAEAVRVTEGQLNPLVRRGHIRQEFAEIFTEEASAGVPELAQGLRGRDALAAAATQVGVAYRFADVSFGDVDIQIDQAGAAAEVRTTATITGALHGRPVRRDDRGVTFQLEKIDGDWRIVSTAVAPRAGRGGEDL